MTSLPLHLTFYIFGAMLGFLVMCNAPTLGIFITGVIVLAVCISALVVLIAANERGEL